VYALVATIPTGRVMGYGHVAAALGVAGAARQVGYAMAALPADTDVPWHRVIHSGGTLAMRGDPVRALIQRTRLEAEGVAFEGDAVPMARFGWVPPLP
jgi:methylated-DNA-protein-cysteine methyltransferase-like protein